MKSESRSEMWFVVVNHICMCHICAKGFIDKNITFYYIPREVSVSFIFAKT